MGVDVALSAKKTFWEFFRYLFAGGFAFVVDFGVLIGCREFLFADLVCGVYLSVLLAFAAGHVVNYLLSLWIVFLDPEERRKGWTWRAFGMFALVGLFGVLITEFGMWIGYGLLHANYVVAKAVMAAIVFTWNFAGRKLVVSKKRAK